MSTFRVSVPSFLGGINQQAEPVRQNNFVEDAENISFLPSEGATKRWPTKFVKDLSADLTDYRLFTIERDEGTFLIALGDDDIRAYDSSGNTVTVEAPGGTSYLSGASAGDIRLQSVADTLFVLNKQTVVSGAPGPTGTYGANNAGLFIKQSNWGVNYTVRWQNGSSGTEYIAQHTVPAEAGRSTASNGVGGELDPVPASFINGTTTHTWTVRQANDASELFFEKNRPANQGGNPVGTGDTVPKDDFLYDPLTQQITYIGNGSLSVGDSLHIGLREDISHSYHLRTDIIRRILEEKISDRNLTITFSNAGDQSSSTMLTHPTLDFEVFEVTDSQSNTFATGWLDKVDSISDLPVVFKDGYVVKVTGENTDAADDYYIEFAANETGGFSKGSWNETGARGLADGALDASTMPYQLKREIDGQGFKFVWSPISWKSREAGDADSNKAPSFIGERIEDLFFFQNRLGFLSQTEVSMSEIGELENFWRTTVLSVPDSDRIDFTAADLDGDVIRHATPFDRALMISTERSQAIVVGEPTVTPTNLAAPVVGRYRTLKMPPPVIMGQSAFFAEPGGEFAHVREFLPGEQADRVNDGRITLGVPRLIPGDVRRLIAGSTEQMISVLSSDKTKMYCYQYMRFDQNLMVAAWTVWTFDAPIEDVSFTESSMYLLLTRNGESVIERIDLGSDRSEDDEEFTIRLDGQAQLSLSGAYDLSNNLTPFFCPFNIETTDDLTVVADGTGNFPKGYEIPIELINENINNVYLQGDWRSEATSLIIGRKYIASTTLSRPLAQKQAGHGHSSILGAAQTCREFRCYLDATGYLKAKVQAIGGQSTSDEFLGEVVDVGQFDTSPLDSSEFRVPIHADVEEFKLTLESDSTLPFTIINGAWDIRFNAKHRLL